MSVMIAVDTGGTFTDVALSVDNSLPVIGKALTTRHQVSLGIMDAIENAAAQVGRRLDDTLRQADVFLYGTTHATNAIVTGDTARTALITTRGFGDLLRLREGGKESAFDFRTPYPRPYVPRALTYEVVERVAAEGDVVTPLDESSVLEALERARHAGVEAVAVCLLWSVMNPAHEARIGELIAEHLPGVPFSLSHQLNPVVREYRRASSVAMDASLKPLMQTHLRRLRDDLAAHGFSGELLTVTSLGGAMHVEDLIERPIYSVRSGPSMAPVAARDYSLVDGVTGTLIVCDTGGTTFDVSMVTNGRIRETRDTWIGGRFAGHITGISSVDVESLGAGGGSIAWMDAGGLLRVGPQSAGAEPGPACYGRGGLLPTLTDACVVLGYLDPAEFLGGRMKLDEVAAAHSMENLADQLGLTIEEMAHAIYTVASDQMVEAIKGLSIRDGIDVREGTLVAGGGAAGLNIIPIARELEIPTLVIPKTAGALSACGGLFSDVVAETSRTFYTVTSDWERARVDELLASMHRELEEEAKRLEVHGLAEHRYSYRVSARYPSQAWELDIPLGWAPGSEISVETLIADFHAEHKRAFAVAQPGSDVECLSWHGRLVTALNGPRPRGSADVDRKPSVSGEKGLAYFDGRAVPIRRYSQGSLEAGMVLSGPAVVDAPTTTIVLPPDYQLRVTPNNYIVERELP
jgi:N-methylhydantoinase A